MTTQRSQIPEHKSLTEKGKNQVGSSRQLLFPASMPLPVNSVFSRRTSENLDLEGLFLSITGSCLASIYEFRVEQLMSHHTPGPFLLPLLGTLSPTFKPNCSRRHTLPCAYKASSPVPASESQAGGQCFVTSLLPGIADHLPLKFLSRPPFWDPHPCVFLSF